MNKTDEIYWDRHMYIFIFSWLFIDINHSKYEIKYLKKNVFAKIIKSKNSKYGNIYRQQNFNLHIFCSGINIIEGPPDTVLHILDPESPPPPSPSSWMLPLSRGHTNCSNPKSWGTDFEEARIRSSVSRVENQKAEDRGMKKTMSIQSISKTEINLLK